MISELVREIPVPEQTLFATPIAAPDSLETDRDDDGRLVVRATTSVDASDPYLEGHFPGFTIFPGVFVVEAVRFAVALALGGEPELAELRAVRSARFSAPLLAGDTLGLEAVVTAAGEPGAVHVKASCTRSDGVTAATVEAEMRRGGIGA